MTTAVIVQARMTSTRLPGKVLKKLGGETVLSHVLRRCRQIPGMDVVCCAVPDDAASDPVADEALRLGVEVCRGSEHDVLDRYYRAAEVCSADVVMRVTSDCPLIDPEICGQLIRLHADTNADYACNNMPPSWPHGLDCEIVSFDWLERSAREANKKYEREHVTQYVRNHPDARRSNLAGPGGDCVRHRWTLDTPDDFTFFEALWAQLPAGEMLSGYRDILEIVTDKPQLAMINSGQDRDEGLKKSIRES